MASLQTCAHKPKIRGHRARRRSLPRFSSLFAWRMKTAFATVLIATTIGSAMPALAASKNAGTKNGSFLKIATDARGVVLGDVSAAMVEGVDSTRWNPAGLGSVETKEAVGTHVQYFQDVKIENVGFAYPLGDSALAVNAFYLGAGELDGRDVQRNKTGDFTFYDLVGSVSYGRKIMTRADGVEVSGGLSVKIVQEKIAEKQFQNPALDAGVIASPKEDWKLGLSLRNLSSSKANFPREVLAGTSYTMFRVLTAGVGLNYSNDAPVRLSVAAEYKAPELENSVIRVGYRTHDSLDNSEDSNISAFQSAGVAGLTMGFGLNYRPPMLSAVQLGLDYALAPFGALGIAHTISLRAKW